MHSMQSVQRGVSTCCGSFGEVDSEEKHGISQSWQFCWWPFWDGEFTSPFQSLSLSDLQIGDKVWSRIESPGWNGFQMFSDGLHGRIWIKNIKTWFNYLPLDPKPWKMKVLNPQYMVITPKNEGCGFPWLKCGKKMKAETWKTSWHIDSDPICSEWDWHMDPTNLPYILQPFM